MSISIIFPYLQTLFFIMNGSLFLCEQIGNPSSALVKHDQKVVASNSTYTELSNYSTRQPMLSHQCTNARQCLSPSFSVSVSPTTIKPFFARVSATFILLQSVKKPILPWWLDLTAEKIIRSRSLP